MFQKIVKTLVGDPHKREIEKLLPIVEQINQLEASYEKLSDEALRAKTTEFRQRVAAAREGIEDEKERQQAERGALQEVLPEAFAAVREASKRTIGLRHYDVQLIGGMVLHKGTIAEMRTGEGKTLVATLPLYLNALTGRGVHLVTVNDYLARRDARWMGPIYQALGLQVGVLQMAARTDNGRNAFLVDLERKSPSEDQNQLRMVTRAEAYQADFTYGTNSEFGFDYLRDNLTLTLAERVQRGHYFAIVDEVDNILIDEARTPLIISGPSQEDIQTYPQMAQIARALRPEDYEVNEKDHAVSLTELGVAHVEEMLDTSLGDPERPEDLTPEQARLLGYLEQCLRAQFLFKRNKDYLVQGGKVIIIDEFTGRLMPGRRWSDGLHQAVEAKENVRIEPENVTYATITLQNYFRMYEKLSGMTGTALTEAEEFFKIYKLDVQPIPTNLEYQALLPSSPLLEVKASDEQGYSYSYYTKRDDAKKSPLFFRRKDFPDVVYRTEEAKLRAICREIIYFNILGRPQLVGTTSVEHSERLAFRLTAEPVTRLLQTLLLRQAWLEKNNRQEDERGIPELAFLNAPLDEVSIADMRQKARSLEISLNPADEKNLASLLPILGLEKTDIPRLVRVIQAGVPNQVLNARKHDEESQIIARAGAFGAVTIATNMAGRGVDIKLGGELSDEVLSDTIRVLEKAGLDPYDMTYEQRYDALRSLSSDDYSIYEESVRAFIDYLDNMEKVRALGGLHVVGSERHEARRIDNQLRGRAARQGDPGSSRFYLSLEDDLMRLFGGQNVEGLLRRLNIDENLPIESGLVGRMVEQSQERVEGTNFDIRKHLLEYDDVLNAQRNRIYSQRDRVFTKEDLSDDILEMVRSELQERIPQALKDEEGPWKLLAFLDQIQPPIFDGEISFPSFTYRLLTDEIRERLPKTDDPASSLRASLLNLTERALATEKEHLMRATRAQIDKLEETMDTQRDERFETLDTFFEGLSAPEEEQTPRRPIEALDELAALVHLPQIRLTPDQLRQFGQASPDIKDLIRQQIDRNILFVNLTRLVGALERRLGEETGLRPNQMVDLDWREVSAEVLKSVEDVFERRHERLLGDEGQISHDLDPALAHMDDPLDETQWVQLLDLMAIGSRMTFDRKTHRQGWRRVYRLNYIYLVAQLIEGQSDKEITEKALDHLDEGLDTLQLLLGKNLTSRLLQPESTLSNLDPFLQQTLVDQLGQERFEELTARPFGELSDEDAEEAQAVLGWRVLNETYRQVLLNVISESWVDYLTRVEALRVSIGLEAYAQRDPLVQYKSKASEMFSDLLRDIRAGVVSRIFVYRPRSVSAAPAERTRGEGAETAGQPQTAASADKQKKKRRRH